MMKKIFILLFILSGCSSENILMKSKVSTLYRQELGVVSPRKLINISNVKLSIHDNELKGAIDTIICLHAIGHGGRDFESFEK